MTTTRCPACAGKGKVQPDTTLLDLLTAYAEVMERKATREASPNRA